MLRRVALVRTDVSEELSASFIRVTRIGELGTTLAVTHAAKKFLRSVSRLLPFFIVTFVCKRNCPYGSDLLASTFRVLPFFSLIGYIAMCKRKYCPL
jgi:hypothetical protein